MRTLQNSVLSALSPSSPSEIGFYHMDFHPGNILLHTQDFRISGIIDWELSGLYTARLNTFITLGHLVFWKELGTDYITAMEPGPDLVRWPGVL